MKKEQLLSLSLSCSARGRGGAGRRGKWSKVGVLHEAKGAVPYGSALLSVNLCRSALHLCGSSHRLLSFSQVARRRRRDERRSWTCGSQEQQQQKPHQRRGTECEGLLEIGGTKRDIERTCVANGESQTAEVVSARLFFSLNPEKSFLPA